MPPDLNAAVQAKILEGFTLEAAAIDDSADAEPLALDMTEAKRHLAVAASFGGRGVAPDFELAALRGRTEAVLIARDVEQPIDRAQQGLEIGLASGERGRFVPFVVTGTAP